MEGEEDLPMCHYQQENNNMTDTRTDFEKYLKPSERETVEKTIDALLAAGYSLDVYDGEEITVKRSTDKAAILAAMGTTEEDYIKVYPMEPRRTAAIGWVRFVWGNEDWVAICDHTINLEAVLQPVFDWMEARENDDAGRTRIGNTPTCEDCDQPTDHCTCE